MRKLFALALGLCMLLLVVPATMAGVPGLEVPVAGRLPQVKIGVADQLVADIKITESVAGNIDGARSYSRLGEDHHVSNVETNEQTRLVLKAPAGVTFSKVPEVEVIDGNLQIDTGNIKTDITAAGEGVLYIPVKSDSTVPSTLRISNIRLTINRTVPEGLLMLKLQGDALNETLDSSGGDTIFPGSKTVAKIIVADCVTPSSVRSKMTTVFKIGDYNYRFNGLQETMDVPPLIESGRVFVPLRYAAGALGVPENNILYSGGRVILFQGGENIQLFPGQKKMVINGTAVNMDVAPITMNGRLLLPLDWLGRVLNAQLTWDQSSRTVTVQTVSD